MATPTDAEVIANLHPEQIVLDDEQWEAFTDLLEEPPKPQSRLAELLRRHPWNCTCPSCNPYSP